VGVETERAMITMNISDFNVQYANMLSKLLRQGMDVESRGMKTKELLCQRFEIDPNDNVVVLSGFETNVSYAEEELAWYLSGRNDIDFSEKIKRTWSKYSDDGMTANSGYGKYLFSPIVNNFESVCDEDKQMSQWQWAKNQLLSDHNSRRCVININSVDHKSNPSTKDFPCTISIHVMHRSGRLIWVTTMRSQDIVLGTRNDVYCFTELQKKIADELTNQGLPTVAWRYVHDCHSLHLYEKYYEVARDACSNTTNIRKRW
jgi:thymidylate synthase